MESVLYANLKIIDEMSNFLCNYYAIGFSMMQSDTNSSDTKRVFECYNDKLIIPGSV